jgi:hypothetical protein
VLKKENSSEITKQIITLLEAILKTILNFKTTYTNRKKEFLWAQPYQAQWQKYACNP